MRALTSILAAICFLWAAMPGQAAEKYRVIEKKSHPDGTIITIECERDGKEYPVLHHNTHDYDKYYYVMRGWGGWDSLDKAAHEICDHYAG